MYLTINDSRKALTYFTKIVSGVVFTLAEKLSLEELSEVVSAKMYSDDDMFLEEYNFDEFDIITEEYTLYLKDKNYTESLGSAKADMIQRSKELLAEWLSRNPMQYTDGNYYSVTEEKQALLNSNLASYERAKTAGIPYPLKWNSTGAECTEWEYSELLALSLSIAAYVAPKVAMQQAIELEIKAAETMEQLDKVVISYEG